MPSKLVEQLSPFYVMEVLEHAKKLESEGRSIVHFEVGEPDFITHEEICDAAIESIKRGETKYTESTGIPELRNTIAKNYNETYKQNISSDNIIITLGSSPALFLSIISTINPGDEIIITNPHYACYPQIIKIAGGVPKKVRIFEENGFQVELSKIKKAVTKKTKAIIINSPANPTGVIMDSSIIEQIAELGITVISDEIYHGLEYGNKSRSVLEFTDDAFVINGFSKLYAMTGWRLGYIIAPENFIRPIQKLQQNLFISPNPFVQMAGIAAIEKVKSKTAKMVDVYNHRRIKMLDGLEGMGFSLKHKPDGAFYVFLNVSDISLNSRELAFDILNNAGVAVTPGIDFGEGGEGYLRFSYATSMELIEKGLGNLKEYFDKQGW
ncbi:MAG: pyridoxal phosphate-dependent aminotransferase [Thermodesulfobacteriota bacterium]